MKRFHIALLALIALAGIFLPLACAYVGPQYPTNYGGPTPTPYPNVSVTVTGTCSTPLLAGCYQINPAAVTISAGGSVTFYDTTGVQHMLLPDNGQGTACGSVTYTLPPGGSVAIPFANVDTYHVHDVNFTGCANYQYCLTCNLGMNETVYSDPD